MDDLVQGMDMKASKRLLRKTILEKRNAMSEQQRNMAALMLTERICGHQWFYLSDTILAFVSYGSEIDTTEIILEALKSGKKVFVPKIVGEDMIFYRITSMDELMEGYKGIREPAGNTEVFVYDAKAAAKVLVLMPGAVFDKYKNRIGYGKGFYDRFLADKEELQLRTIGVGFQCQLVEELPAQEWDIKPYQVICV